MALGIVSDDEFESEISSLTVPAQPKVSIVDMEKGRGKDNVEVPDSLRKIIGEESAINGRESALDMANRFGVSPSSVSAYKNGSTSTSSMDEQPNREFINGARNRVAKKARNRLVMALNSLTQEKIENSRAKDIAGIAKDMSAVIKTMEPEVARFGGGSGPTFVFYSPQVRSEKVFDVVHVKE